MENNHLKLNLTKTNFIIFSPKCNKFKNLSNLNLSINDNVIIPQTETCKYLGMTIDKKLNWTPHIYNLKQSLSKIVGTLYRIRHFLNKKSLNIILHSLIITKINYGLICYGRANKTNLKPIKILLNNALRCINFLHRRDKRISTIYYEQGVLQLRDLFELQLGKLCYKFNKKLLPPSFSKFFVNTSEIHRYNTRKSKKSFFRPKNKNSSGYNRLQNLGAKLWNQTSDMLKKCQSIKSFNINFKKQRLKTYIDFWCSDAFQNADNTIFYNLLHSLPLRNSVRSKPLRYSVCYIFISSSCYTVLFNHIMRRIQCSICVKETFYALIYHLFSLVCMNEEP